MADSTRSKTSYVHALAIAQFLSRGGFCWLHTWTFQENITDKGEAVRRFAPIDDWYRRHGVKHLDTWERQKRGAWHVHVLVDHYCHVRDLRSFAVARGWGKQSPDCRAVGGCGVYDGRVGPVARYLTKYLSKENCEGVPRNVRLTGGSMALRVGNTRFSWVGGHARLWREGCDLHCTVHGRAPSFRDRQRVIELAVGYFSDWYGERLTLEQVVGLSKYFGDAFGVGAAGIPPPVVAVVTPVARVNAQGEMMLPVA